MDAGCERDADQIDQGKRSRDARLERLRGAFTAVANGVDEMIDVVAEAQAGPRHATQLAQRARQARVHFASARAAVELDTVDSRVAVEMQALQNLIEGEVLLIDSLNGKSRAKLKEVSARQQLESGRQMLVARARDLLAEIEHAGGDQSGTLDQKAADKRYLRVYLGGLAISFPVAAGLAALSSVAIYLAGGGTQHASGVWSVSLAGAIAAGTWLVLGVVCRPLFLPQGSNDYEYDQITVRHHQLWSRLVKWTEAGDEARAVAPSQDHPFPGPGRGWADANGYLTLWCQIHFAEEALLIAAPADVVVAEAANDVLRFKDSRIDQRDTLLPSVSAAIKVLRPRRSHAHLIPAKLADVDVATAMKETDARRSIRRAREALNTYRESLWEGLVQARNEFVLSLMVTTVCVSAVVLLLVVRETDRGMMFVASILFLDGALVGLFARLAGLLRKKSLEHDFGLETAHLLGAPILSGVAAVVGVLVVGLSHIAVGSVNIGTASAASGGPLLRTIFNFGTNTVSLVTAGIFGLTPELLIRYLQNQADQLQQSLSSSELWGKDTSGQQDTPVKPTSRRTALKGTLVEDTQPVA
jgi:hypothetical protein